jgi:hypothetical protein
MRSVVGRARLIWGVSEIEFIICGLVAGLSIAACCTTLLNTVAKIAETEVLALSTRNKVEAAETWALEGRLPPASRPSHDTGKYFSFLPNEVADEGASYQSTPMLRDLDERVLTLRPAVSTSGSGALAWVCGRAPAPPGFTVIGKDRTDLPQDALVHACRSHP